jgi:hypothetical protein
MCRNATQVSQRDKKVSRCDALWNHRIGFTVRCAGRLRPAEVVGKCISGFNPSCRARTRGPHNAVASGLRTQSVMFVQETSNAPVFHDGA